MTAAKVSTIRTALIAAGVLAPEAPEPRHTIDLTRPGVAASDPRATFYADKAMRDECTAMALAQPGSRNETLNKCAYKLGSLVSGGYLDRDTMVDGLWNAARQAGLDDREIRQTLRSGARAGAATPRVLHLAEQVDTIPGPVWFNENDQIQPAESDQNSDTPPPVDSPDSSPDRPEILPTLDLDKLLSEPLDGPDWLAEPLIEQGGLYALYSPAKAGKSLFTLDMVAALAAGKPCLGYPAKAPVDVLYVDHENGRRDLQQRFTDLGYRTGELSHLHYLHFPNMPMLDTAAGARYLYFNALHHQAKLVVIDTVSRAIAGDENASDTWHALYRLTMVALKREGIAVLRLDHMGKDADKGMRGSSAKLSDVDAAFRLERTYDNRIRLVREVTRNGNSPEVCTYEQLSGPLRHEPADDTKTQRDAVNDALRLLDQLGIPQDHGRDRIRKTLRQANVKIRNETLSRAISIRKLQVTDHFAAPEDD